MAKDIEIVSISSLIANSTFPVPTYDAGVRSVIGSTADGAAQLSSVATLQSWLKQNQYHTCTAGSTFHGSRHPQHQHYPRVICGRHCAVA
jgi:hypothetical protein